MVDAVLGSRGPENCPHAATCPVAKEDDLRHLCVPGEECPWERRLLQRFIRDASRNYTECLRWLTRPERDLIICRLGILALRRIRLSALIANEGLIRDKISSSGVVYGKQSALGIGRYATAIHNETQPLMTLLLENPEAEAMVE